MSTNYQKPILRKLQPVSTKEQVFLNFLRCQQNQCSNGQEIIVTLRIYRTGLKWQRNNGM